jgi:DNA primase
VIPADLIDRARSVRIEDEIERRGIRLAGKVDRAGPCPICHGRDRFSINVRKQLWHCRGCAKGGDIVSLVQHVDDCNFREAVESLTGERADEPRKQNVHPLEPKSKSEGATSPADALRLWSASADPRGTLAERYLASRGLDLGEDIAGEVLRWHPGIRAMLARGRWPRRSPQAA